MKTIRIITIFLALCIALGACAKASPKAPRRAKNKKNIPTLKSWSAISATKSI